MKTDVLSAESAVCGSILIDPRCLKAVAEILTEDDFYLAANRAIFSAAVSMEREGGVIDPVTILSAAKGAVSRDYMLELMKITTTAVNAEMYAHEARKDSLRHKLEDVGLEIQKRVSVSEDPREVIGYVQKYLEKVERQDTTREISTSAEAMLSFYRRREQLESGAGFVRTGLGSLDTLLGGGLLCGGLYVLAARPGMGKTTFAIGIAEYVAEKGAVLLVSLEMDEDQISAKRISRLTGISYSELLMKSLCDAEMKRVAECANKLSTKPFFSNKRPYATVDDIAALARKVNGLKLLVIDYFGLIKSTNKAAKRYEQMTEISGQLKILARALDVPVLCLAQLNRENMQSSNKRPQLSHLRETGALEQDADGVIFLHREDYYRTENGEEDDRMAPVPMEVILAKNRHAGTGVCNTAFYMDIGRIVPAERR